MKKGQTIKYKWFYTEIKTGIIEWIEPKDNKMPYRKIKLTNGDIITENSIR